MAGQERLFIGILEQALEDVTFKKNEYQSRYITRADWQDARDWIFTENHEMHGLDWLCDLIPSLNRTAEDVRTRVRNYACPQCGVRVSEAPCRCVSVNEG